MKLLEKASFKVIANVEFFVSPSRPTTLGFDYLAFFNPIPQAFRVDILVLGVYSGLTVTTPFEIFGSSPIGVLVLNYTF